MVISGMYGGKCMKLRVQKVLVGSILREGGVDLEALVGLVDFEDLTGVT